MNDSSPPPSLETRKRFCPVPWMHMSSRPNGDYRLCCRVRETKIFVDGQPAKWGKTPIQQVWNSDYMQEIRRKVLNDEFVSECDYCYQDENNGLDSLRY